MSRRAAAALQPPTIAPCGLPFCAGGKGTFISPGVGGKGGHGRYIVGNFTLPANAASLLITVGASGKTQLSPDYYTGGGGSGGNASTVTVYSAASGAVAGLVIAGGGGGGGCGNSSATTNPNGGPSTHWDTSRSQQTLWDDAIAAGTTTTVSWSDVGCVTCCRCSAVVSVIVTCAADCTSLTTASLPPVISFSFMQRLRNQQQRVSDVSYNTE